MHLQELGVLEENSVIVHANGLDEAEESAARETGCQIVWCPTAFFALGIVRSASFKGAERYHRGVHVSLSPDGAFVCTPGETILAAHYASQTYEDPLSPRAFLEMQTINAAAGRDAELGSVDSGKRVGVVVRSARAAEGYPTNNPIHCWH